MDKFIFELNKQEVRQLSVIAKQNDRLTIMITHKNLMIVTNNSEFFKGLIFPIESKEELFFTVKSSALNMIGNAEGAVCLEIMGNQLQISYSLSKKSLEEGKLLWWTRRPISPVNKLMVLELLGAINISSDSYLEIDSLSNLKLLIASCNKTGSGLTVVQGTAGTDNNTVIFYKDINNKDLHLGLGVTALKEIEKFKLNCPVVSHNQYLIMKRNNYILGVRKANVSDNLAIPENIKTNSSALISMDINMSYILDLIKNVDLSAKELGKLHEKELVIEFNKNISTANINGDISLMFTPVSNIFNVQGDEKLTINSIKFDLLNLLPLVSILEEKTHITIFNRVVKFDFSNNTYGIIRHEGVS